MSIEWNFPNNGCGQIRGVSDAGIETFTGTEIQSLAREVCQNSIDASKDKESCIRVEFEQYFIDSSMIPGYDQFASKIEKAYRYWMSKNSEKTKIVLNKAYKSIKRDKVCVLRASDYNTTGLIKPYEDSDQGWNALTKLDGGATKNGDKAGAFGIGKNAPFCNSDYRLVFYRTLNEDGEMAAQGMSRFISFPEDLNDALQTMTTGIGYYGNPNANLPVNSICELDDLNAREEVGTDVFVYGFNANSDWADEVKSEILNNFLMSIYKKLLVVSVDGSIIDDENLGNYVEKYKLKAKNTYWYYQVLKRSETREFCNDFHGLGKIKLSVLVDSQEKMNHKILITRNSGMKLFELPGMNRLISFSGILEMSGEKLNEFFRDMETPAHDKWLPSRHAKNPTLAKEYYNELKDWIRECIQSLGEHSCDEEIEVTGLGGVLQKESKSTPQTGDDKKETLQDTIGNINIQQRTVTGKPKGFFYGSDGEEKSKSDDVSGTVDKNGIFPATRNLGGTRKRAVVDKHKGSVTPNGHDTVHIMKSGNINKELKNVRVIKKSQNTYSASFILPREVKTGHVEIVTVGENGKSNKLAIANANGMHGCEGIQINSLGVGFTSMRGNEKVSFEFTLLDNRNYAMEVNVYEHN